MVIGLLFVGFVAASQAQAPTPCIPAALDAATMQLCLGEEEMRRGEALPPGGAERRRSFEAATQYYRRASVLGTSEVQLKALTALALTYDVQRLNDRARREAVLRELSTLIPTKSIRIVFYREDRL